MSSKEAEEEMRRGQVWSIDVLLAVVIFVSIILIFYVTMTSRQKPQLKDLEIESSNLKIELEKNQDIGFLQNNQVNDTKFQMFISNATEDYDSLKEKLGIKGDFCMFYEDSDGFIVLIRNNQSTNISRMNLTGIGSPDLCVGGYKCGTNIPCD
ncbi:hypothetical protein JW756_00900 [Candidatus Woesearchaeota archaeon]|nr:hypothetical protein [Candidatus Woesearchaeota archaeon]